MNTSQETIEPIQSGGVDRFGALASTACAIHCAACALVPASLAALGLDFLIGHETEWALAGIAVFFALIALFMSVRSHRNGVIIAILSIGIVGLLTARIMEGQAHHGHGEHGEHAEEGEHAADGKHDDHKKHAEDDKHAEVGKDENHKKHAEHGKHDQGSKHDKHGKHDDHKEHGKQSEHDDHGDEHWQIEALGISSGILLVIGHISNLVLLRRRRESQCTTSPAGDC